jgi:hypothetical protein
MNKVHILLLGALIILCQCVTDELDAEFNGEIQLDVSRSEELNDLSKPASIDSTHVIYESATANYKIQFPGIPKHITEYVPLEEGEINVSMDTYSPNDSIIYAVKYDEFPISFFEDIDEAFKTEVVQNALTTTKNNYGLTTEVVYEDRLADGTVGCYYQGHNDKLYVSCLYILNANKLYQVVLTCVGGFQAKKVIDEFFSSFEIVNS